MNHKFVLVESVILLLSGQYLCKDCTDSKVSENTLVSSTFPLVFAKTLQSQLHRLAYIRLPDGEFKFPLGLYELSATASNGYLTGRRKLYFNHFQTIVILNGIVFTYNFTIPYMRISYNGNLKDNKGHLFSGRGNLELLNSNLTISSSVTTTNMTCSPPTSEVSMVPGFFSYSVNDVSYDQQQWLEFFLGLKAAQKAVDTGLKSADSNMFRNLTRLLSYAAQNVTEKAWKMSLNEVKKHENLDFCKAMISAFNVTV